MTPPEIVQRIQEFTDIELAVLLSLIAKEHCLIRTEYQLLNSLQQELQLIAADLFGLSHVVIQCNPGTTLDEFSNSLLTESDTQSGLLENEADDPDKIEASIPGQQAANSWRKRPSLPQGTQRQTKEKQIANIVIVKDLEEADYEVQIQALELLRTKRILTHTAVHAAPKIFLMVIIKSSTGIPLNKHLNDHIFLSHYHYPEDSFPNLEEASEWLEDDASSSSSVVHKPIRQKLQDHGVASLDQDTIQKLASLSNSVALSAELKCYLQNIIVFLRMHRAVCGGITPRASKYFDLLVKCLAPLHNLDYVTPSQVALAARKIYGHRIEITSPENERSVQYGSNVSVIADVLEGITPESIIEEVLSTVDSPL